MGNDEADNQKSARGIAGFALVGGGTINTWKVQGKIGGYTECVFSEFVLSRRYAYAGIATPTRFAG